MLTDGFVVFDNLTISESSTKHKEREFYLLFTLLRNDGHEIFHKNSRSFYAYSHKKVLQRRGRRTMFFQISPDLRERKITNFKQIVWEYEWG